MDNDDLISGSSGFVFFYYIIFILFNLMKWVGPRYDKIYVWIRGVNLRQSLCGIVSN